MNGSPVPVIINCRNRVTMARNLYKQVSRLHRAVPFIVDNYSTWEPMIDWISSNTIKYVALTDNRGCYAPWSLFCNNSTIIDWICFHVQGETGQLPEYYVVTDEDLDLSRIPFNALDVLQYGLDHCDEIIKCGFGLEIQNLPKSNPFRRAVIQDQAKYWHKPFKFDEFDDYTFFHANIDTTFAMYRVKDLPKLANTRVIGRGIRTDYPFVATHLPWHMSPEDWTAEDWHYFENAETYTYWTQLLKDYIEARGLKNPWRKNGSEKHEHNRTNDYESKELPGGAGGR